MSTEAIIALGGNLGNRAENLRAALLELAAHPDIELLGSSSFYESHALTVSGTDQTKPNYLNAVAKISTGLDPVALLETLNRLEAEAGRNRSERWESRTLDLDIITFGDLAIDTAALTIPHPAAQERAFVLVPWAELDPEAELVGHGFVGELAKRFQGEVWVYEEN